MATLSGIPASGSCQGLIAHIGHRWFYRLDPMACHHYFYIPQAWPRPWQVLVARSRWVGGCSALAELAESSCEINPGSWETSQKPKVWCLSQDGGLLQVVSMEPLVSFNPHCPVSLVGTAWPMHGNSRLWLCLPLLISRMCLFSLLGWKALSSSPSW